MNGIDAIRPLDHLTDEALMARLTRGDDDALAPLHDRYAGLVCGLVARSLDRTSAEEITQDVFVTIWRKADAFDPDRGPFRPWLLLIAQSRMRNELRRLGRRPQCVPDPAEMQLGAAPDNAPLPEEESWRRDLRAAVVTAVAALPPPQREAIRLAYFAEMTQLQVAARLDLPLGTVKTRLRAGKQRLRLSLQPIVAAAADPAPSAEAPRVAA